VQEEDLKIQNYINQNYPGAVRGGPILSPSMKAPPLEKKPEIIDEDGEILKIREIIKIKQTRLKATEDSMKNSPYVNIINEGPVPATLSSDPSPIHQNIVTYKTKTPPMGFHGKMESIEEEKTFNFNASDITDTNVSQDYKNLLRNLSSMSYDNDFNNTKDTLLESDASILEIKKNIEGMRNQLHSFDLDESDIMKYLEKNSDFTIDTHNILGAKLNL
jgi:hypothetical protein